MNPWKLPSRSDDGWQPVVRLFKNSSVTPFGYYVDPEDNDILLPIDSQLEKLEEARKYLQEYPSRAVAEWLTKETGRYISHVGLLKRMKLERANKVNATSSEYWATRVKEAEKKAQECRRKIGCKDSKPISRDK